ncbi:MAG: SPOR domain-containing protein [Candidatus Marinimicrobia bacterium]|nr:SPOR domain-containing protein [Candidatus Neomarinimicrobiota bacterium]
MIRILIAIITIFSFLVSQTEEKKKIDFDPNTLNEPESNWPKVMHPLLPIEDFEVKSDQGQVGEQLINGYRVQVMATRYYEKADSLRSALTTQYGSEVYIDFEAPNYKVRVGNCIVRKQAEELQDALKSRGYDSAWIIRTRVYSN